MKLNPKVTKEKTIVLVNQSPNFGTKKNCQINISQLQTSIYPLNEYLPQNFLPHVC